MPSSSSNQLTDHLQLWSAGDPEAGGQALGRLYADLRRIAGRLFQRERGDHTLQATAVVHEAYLELSRLDRMTWKSRTHFLAMAARMMRRVLVDHSRERGARKRGGDLQRVTLGELSHLALPEEAGLEEVDDALNRLAELSTTDARIVELRIFGGLTQEETAEVLGLSRKTVGRRWRRARAWLYGELSRGAEDAI